MAADVVPYEETSPDQRAAAFAEVSAKAGSADPGARILAAKGLAALGTPAEALAALGKLAEDPHVGVRMAATAALASLPWKGRLALLGKRLDDDDLGIATMAAQGLAHARDRRGVALLRSVLGERKLRFDALESLFELGDTESVAEAQRLYGGVFVSAFERGICALMLARQGDEKARAFVLKHVADRKAEARPMLVVHLAAALGGEGRAYLEKLAATEDDYLRESALLALVRLDASYWPRVQEAIGRWSDEDPLVAGELLLELFDVDWKRASVVADAQLGRPRELGAAARQVRLAAHLRSTHPDEVLLRCA